MPNSDSNPRQPLSHKERVRILRAIRKGYTYRVRGGHVARLVKYVEEALDPRPQDFRLLGIGSDAAEEFATLQKRLLDGLKEIGAQAREIVGHLPPARASSRFSLESTEPADFAEAANARPWLRRLDPLRAAIRALQGSRAGEIVPDAHNVRAALDLLSKLGTRPIPQNSGGRPYGQGLAPGLVRAVCVYRHSEGLPVSFVWQDQYKREREDDCLEAKAKPGGSRPPKEWEDTTDTNKLILVVAGEFGIDEPTSRLRSALGNYGVELNEMGRDAPDEIDLYGNLYEEKPKRRRKV